MDNIFGVLPFENPLVVLALNGSVLLEALEHNVAKYDRQLIDMPGGFLQFSGMCRIDYKLINYHRLVIRKNKYRKARLKKIVSLIGDSKLGADENVVITLSLLTHSYFFIGEI